MCLETTRVDGCVVDPNPPGPVPSLLDWKTVHRDMQWGVILLLGGGFAIAEACKVASVFYHSCLHVQLLGFIKRLATIPPAVNIKCIINFFVDLSVLLMYR